MSKPTPSSSVPATPPPGTPGSALHLAAIRWDYDNLYTSGQVGVDPSTGEVKWFYQHTPNDAWDFSGNNELVLFEYDDDGKTVKAHGSRRP